MFIAIISSNEPGMAPVGRKVSADPQGPRTPEGPRPRGAERRGLFARLRSLVYESLIAPLAFSKHPPRFDARGVCIGLVVGLIIPLGGHIVTLTLLRAVIRFNFLAALGSSLVSNPLNAIPLYYGYYCLGSWIIGRPVDLDFAVFTRLMNPIADAASFWHALSAFMDLSKEILVRWFVAAAVLAGVFAPLSYFVTYKIQQDRCKRAARKMGLAYEKFLEDLEKGSQ